MRGLSFYKSVYVYDNNAKKTFFIHLLSITENINNSKISLRNNRIDEYEDRHNIYKTAKNNN
jgi:hypothetical protein